MNQIDAFSLLPTQEIKCLEGGFVRLVDCMPRLIPSGRTSEVAIVMSARISTAGGLKEKATDDNLIRYLYRNHHTSPFEAVKFTFHIRCPIFVRTHLIRHRTANINEFSQRYSEIKDGDYYSPQEMGIRFQSKTNKQSSVPSNEVASLGDNEIKQQLSEKCSEAENHLDSLFGLYEEMIDLGMSRETARFCLPNATYTELFFTMDLHNLIRFFTLRLDEHTQAETVVFARAMRDLIRPLVPVAMECLEKYTLNSVTLSMDEIEAIRGQKRELTGTISESEKRDYGKKLEKLGLTF